MSSHDAVKEELLQTNEEFRRLYEEHQGCKRRLKALIQKSLPSQDDEIEAKRIKVEKLKLKDRMEAMIRSQLDSQVSA